MSAPKMTHVERLRRLASETDGLDEIWLSEAADRIAKLEPKGFTEADVARTALEIAGYAFTLECFEHVVMDGACAQQLADKIEAAITRAVIEHGKVLMDEPADCRHEWGPPGEVDTGAVCRECGAKCPVPWERARLMHKTDERLVDWLHRCADYDDDPGQAVRRMAADEIDKLQRDLVAIYATDCASGEPCAARFPVPGMAGKKGCVHYIAQLGLERLGLDEEARKAAEHEWLQETRT